jgi:hypothetical protein
MIDLPAHNPDSLQSRLPDLQMCRFSFPIKLQRFIHWLEVAIAQHGAQATDRVHLRVRGSSLGYTECNGVGESLTLALISLFPHL